jgi:hypothetical protein
VPLHSHKFQSTSRFEVCAAISNHYYLAATFVLQKRSQAIYCLFLLIYFYLDVKDVVSSPLEAPLRSLVKSLSVAMEQFSEQFSRYCLINYQSMTMNLSKWPWIWADTSSGAKPRPLAQCACLQLKLSTKLTQGCTSICWMHQMRHHLTSALCYVVCLSRYNQLFIGRLPSPSSKLLLFTMGILYWN